MIVNLPLGHYGRQKSSGVIWPPTVPDHWDVAKLGHRAEVQLGKMLDSAKIVGDHLYPYLRNTDVQWDKINIDDLPMMDFDAEDRKKFSLRPNDLLVCEGGEIGRVAIWGGELADCYYQKALHRIRPTKGDVARFLYWSITSAAISGAFSEGTNTTTIAHLPAEKLRAHRFCFPPIGEQIAISDFLDLETAKIDGLIAKQTEFLTLLDEHHRALVTKAVTQGLEASVSMRDTGIASISSIPAHWNIRPLKHLALSWCDGPFGSGLKSEHYTDYGIRVVRLQNIGEHVFKGSDQAYVSREHFESLGGHDVRPGDLLIAGLGDEGNPLGRACIYPAEAGPAMVKADCFRVRIRDRSASPDFVASFLSSSAARGLISEIARGSTRERINLSAAISIPIPVPPLAEQKAIMEILASQLGVMTITQTRSIEMIEHLRERRSALITAAVTGQIDVTDPAMTMAAA